MRISLLVPTLGTRPVELKRLLDSLKIQTFSDWEAIIVTQDNHQLVGDIIKNYIPLSVRQIKTDLKGLSKARNEGMKYVTGDVVVLSDDDCWYPADALDKLSFIFKKNPSINVLMTQIMDPIGNVLYKNYPNNRLYITQKIQLVRKSSIEIAFKKNSLKNEMFDEKLGLGSDFVCGEEVDFLIRNYSKDSQYLYEPIVSVFHRKKEGHDTRSQIEAKGAVYGKNFNIFVCIAVLTRDLLLKHENNIIPFFKGYIQYKQMSRK